ncbi:hypothetical protein GFJ94_07190 [Flavobacterium sp. LMO8]|uniref:hypothetical protein n=1 Tax=Flavobacterium sp. LMO8 TaxID=2654244 RepID=UPI0012928461|nr:hypothetical protein [Flavobacterium sp. LMO8]MQP24847.1 hypothetical protein [Flavobacterium sp. LMO8]
MKFRLLFLILLIFQISNSQSNFNKVKNEINRNGYSIFYDSTLRLDESGRNGVEFYLFTEKENSQDNFVENINLIIQNLEGLNIDLNKFVAITEGQILASGELIRSKRIIVNGNECHSIIYEGTFNGLNLMFLQYNIVKNDKAYVLTYTANRKDFEKYFNEMELIMKSFKIK